MSALAAFKYPFFSDSHWTTLSKSFSGFFSLLVLFGSSEKGRSKYGTITQILKLFMLFASVHSFFPFDLTKLLNYKLESWSFFFFLSKIREKFMTSKHCQWHSAADHINIFIWHVACDTLRKIPHVGWSLKDFCLFLNTVKQASCFYLECEIAPIPF